MAQFLLCSLNCWKVCRLALRTQLSNVDTQDECNCFILLQSGDELRSLWLGVCKRQN